MKEANKEQNRELNRESGNQNGNLKRRKKKRPLSPVVPAMIALSMLIGILIGYRIWGWEAPYNISLRDIEAPEWIEQDFIRKNIFSRPDVSRRRVNNIVIHYVANPDSSAEFNRRYFDSLADQDPESTDATSASSHFIVGLDGEIIQCIPLSEIAYANAPRNDDTVSIEVCHSDESGQFNQATYDSVVKLTAWLCDELELDENDVIRHYDVSGKLCPLYYVDHEDAWKQLQKDVKNTLER